MIQASLPAFARSSKRRPAILLGTVVAGGLLAIILMRSLTGGLGQVMADTGIDQAVNGFISFMRDGQTRAATLETVDGDPFADLVTDHYAAMQVPPEDLRSNPFITPWTVRTGLTNNHVQTPLTLAQRRDLRRQELKSVDELLLVQSIMTGSNPLATINDTILRIGDEITLEELGVVCILNSITRDSVTLEARDDAIDLKVTVTVSIRRPS
jgi:hypothetical protein